MPPYRDDRLRSRITRTTTTMKIIGTMEPWFRRLSPRCSAPVVPVPLYSPFVQFIRQQHAERAVELIDAAHRLDARRILRYPSAIAQTRAAIVAGARDDS